MCFLMKKSMIKINLSVLYLFCVKSKFHYLKYKNCLTLFVFQFFSKFLSFQVFQPRQSNSRFFQGFRFFGNIVRSIFREIQTLHEMFRVCFVSVLKNKIAAREYFYIRKLTCDQQMPANFWFAYLHTNKTKHLQIPTKIKYS